MTKDLSQLLWEKEQRIEDLTRQIKDLETQLKKEKNRADGYGLKWEEKPEIFEERSKNALPVLQENTELLINKGEELDHLIIEGDNYHSLSALSYTHKGKIDLIYIDPPYNTGKKDFVYNDNYVDSEDDYRHSKWLSFMNKRLRLAKDLLSDDGVIFISIDDNEQANLKLLCDDIFGEKNFISMFPRKTTEHIRTNAPYELQNLNDFVLLYSKNKSRCILRKKIVGEKVYEHQDEFWYYLLKPFQNSWENWTRQARPNLYYPIFYDRKTNTLSLEEKEGAIKILPKSVKNQDGRRLRSKQKFEKDKLLLEYKNWTLYRKEYRDEKLDMNKYQVEKNWLDNYPNRLGAVSLTNLWLGWIFSYPKPPELLIFLFQLASKSSVILDFFAWSGTTGHAVLELNKQDGGKRQFILCSSRENTAHDPDKNICKNITYERVRRVLTWYTNAKGEEVAGLGGGNLRYYTTEFIQKKENLDVQRMQFKNRCDELLCIKEGTFDPVSSEYISENLRAYHKNDHYTVVVYDLRDLSSLNNLLNMLKGQISLYLFTSSKENYLGELDLNPSIAIGTIPDEILETYQKIF